MATFDKPTQNNQMIAMVCVLGSSFLVSFVFLMSRMDSDMKLLALGACISQVSALMATASTILVGKSFEGGAKIDAHPGETATVTSSLKVDELPKA